MTPEAVARAVALAVLDADHIMRGVTAVPADIRFKVLEDAVLDTLRGHRITYGDLRYLLGLEAMLQDKHL